jgi:biopolymer transport protein ExbD
MARSRIQIPQPDADVSAGPSALIDVCFLLLVYFLLVTTLQPREVDLGLRLGGFPIEPAPAQRPLTLKLEADGSVVAEPAAAGQPLGRAGADFDFPALRARLELFKQLAAAGRQEPMVVLLADDHADHQSLIGVFNAIHASGIASVSLDQSRRD